MPKSRKRLPRRARRPSGGQSRELQIAEFFEQTVARHKVNSPHRVLYHYTTYSGALNILSSQEFWSTAHDCTNDEAELASAHSIVTEVAQVCRQRYQMGTPAEVLDAFLATYPGSMMAQMRTTYLSCFSLARDDENQWRVYGDGGRGICLGIRVLEEPPPKSRQIISIRTEVEYSESALREWLAAEFEKICLVLARFQPSCNNCEAGVSALHRIAAFASIRAKRENFRSEQEVRHITFSRRKSGVVPKERLSAAGKVVRYLPVSLRADGKLIALDEIIIGANQDAAEAREQLENLLAAKGYTVGSIEYPRITVSSTSAFSSQS
jgi:hypothetical protein